jgi:hypothetical protein
MRRARWLATGVALGAGGTIWARRRLGALPARLEPTRVAGELADATRERVRAAVGAGKAQAHKRETEIRNRLEEWQDPPRHVGAASRRGHRGPNGTSTGLEMTAR